MCQDAEQPKLRTHNIVGPQIQCTRRSFEVDKIQGQSGIFGR